MLLEKMFSYCFFFSIFFLFLFLISDLSFSFLYYDYFLFFCDSMSLKFFLLNFDFEFLIFFLMVNFVTTLVVIYSGQYMEHYNNKKFFFLLLSFFLSMIILVISGSMLVLVIGWDGLGITSLLLIMFYPNKTTLFNSFLTSFFNRLGDVFLMLCMGILICLPHFFFYLVEDFSRFYFILILVCSLTKSAQFPMSSWLPAAMSAPTPISAMVHSSTLVTAGVFLILKIHDFFTLSYLGGFLMLVSLSTFLIGGALANLELDFKKVVAFSTMSQISMIIFFSCSLMMFISVIHMVFHAFFKTLLFVSCGMLFMNFLSDQLSKKFFFSKSEISISFIFFLSIFCMSGLCFSSSFYSKDLFIEMSLINMEMWCSLLVLLGSIFTITYCSKIFSSIFSFPRFTPFMVDKQNLFLYIFLFSFIVCLGSIFLKNLSNIDLTPTVEYWEVLTLALTLFSFLYLSMYTKNFSVLSLPLEIFFMKSFSFSLWSKLGSFIEDGWTDLSLFKPKFITNLKHSSDSNFFKMSSLYFFFVNLFLSFLFC